MLTADARVQLGTIGFVGDKYVEIIPGTPGQPTINEMDTVLTRDAGSAEAMFRAGEEAISEAGSVVSNLDTLLLRMNRGEGTLGRLATDEELYREMTRLLANLTKLTNDLQKNQERLVKSIEQTSDALGNVSDQVSKNTGTLGRIVNDPALYDNLTATSARLDTIMHKINTAEAAWGCLLTTRRCTPSSRT